MGVEQVKEFLSRYHISAKEDWVNQAVQVCKEYGCDSSLKQLCASVLDLFLNSDLLESYVAPMKVPAIAVKLVITKPIIFQITSAFDIARPLYQQFTELTLKNDDLSWFHGDDHQDKDTTGECFTTSRQRLLKLSLFDGTNLISGIEYGSLSCIPTDVKLGTKIILTSRVVCRKGIVLLNDSNCQLLGGDVDILNNSSDPAQKFADRLGINYSNGKRVQNLKAPDAFAPAKIKTKAADVSHNSTNGNSTLSPFLVRMPRNSNNTTKTSSSSSEAALIEPPVRLTEYPCSNRIPLKCTNAFDRTTELSSTSMLISSLGSPESNRFGDLSCNSSLLDKTTNDKFQMSNVTAIKKNTSCKDPKLDHISSSWKEKETTQTISKVIKSNHSVQALSSKMPDQNNNLIYQSPPTVLPTNVGIAYRQYSNISKANERLDSSTSSVENINKKSILSCGLSSINMNLSSSSELSSIRASSANSTNTDDTIIPSTCIQKPLRLPPLNRPIPPSLTKVPTMICSPRRIDNCISSDIPEKRIRTDTSKNEDVQIKPLRKDLQTTKVFSDEDSDKTIALQDTLSNEQVSVVDKYKRLNIIYLSSALRNKTYWMLPKTVSIQGVCHVPSDLKARNGHWVLHIHVTDESVERLYCEVSPILLDRMLGFTVQSCQDPCVIRNKAEMQRRKSRALSVAHSLLRMDLILSIEMYPERDSTPLILDVKTISEALNVVN